MNSPRVLNGNLRANVTLITFVDEITPYIVDHKLMKHLCTYLYIYICINYILYF